MRNMSYMGRVVVKLVIIAIIAFVVITTAVYIINRNNRNEQVKELPGGGTAIGKQENNKAEKSSEATNKEKQASAAESAKKADETKTSQSLTSTSELPKTGPADTALAALAIATTVFSGAVYVTSRKATQY